MNAVKIYRNDLKNDKVDIAQLARQLRNCLKNRALHKNREVIKLLVEMLNSKKN